MSDDGDSGMWEAEYSTGYRANYRGFVVVKEDYALAAALVATAAEVRRRREAK